MDETQKLLPQINKFDFLSTALEKMKEHDVRHLPVFNNSHELVGTISKADINAFKHMNMPLKNLRVLDFMSKNLACVQTTTRIQDVLHMIMKKNIHCVLVKQHGQLVGMISAEDLLKFLSKSLMSTHPPECISDYFFTNDDSWYTVAHA